MAESLCCSPATATTLLIGYAPTQNKKFKVFKKQQQKKVIVTKGAEVREAGHKGLLGDQKNFFSE